MKKKSIAIAAITVLATIALFGFIIYAQKDIEGLLERTAPYSHLVFFLVQLLSVIFAPIPSNVTAAAGAMVFGAIPTFILTYLAVISGSIAVFMFVRFFKRKFDHGRLEAKIEDRRYLSLLYEKPSAFLFIAFLLPIFPDDILCYLAGLTRIKFWKFALIAIVARPWGLMVASGLGGIGTDITPQKVAIAAAILILLLAAGILYRKFFHDKVVSFLEGRKERRDEKRKPENNPD